MNDDMTDSIVLKTKLAVGAKYFLNRPRPRLTDFVGTIESIVKLLWDSTIDLTDDSIDNSADENDNSSLLSAWSSFE
jgi:hypothetical protein